MFRYLKQHYLYQLNVEPNIDYVGHPVNAYHFLRHIAFGWHDIINQVLRNQTWWKNNRGDVIWNNVVGQMCTYSVPFYYKINYLL